MQQSAHPVARFDDLRAGTALQFDALVEEVVAHTPEQVRPALARVEQASSEGLWAFGYVGYEAAAGLTGPPPTGLSPTPGTDSGPPLVWFGLAPAPSTPTAWTADRGDYRVGPWQPEWTAAEHAERVAAVHRAIAAGETYQCNLTTRLHGTLTGDLHSYHRDLADHQQGSHNAYLDTGDWVVLSASPECFLRWERDTLRSVPMKGTAPRGPDAAADRQARDALRASAKDVAENVMIVDLIRNDLSRVCEPGSVRVDGLLDCERYPTVWQLTSAVSGTVRPGTTLTDVFTHLFPCGSVTGAPKARTMELVQELESSPRGVYCGAVGYVAPRGSQVRAAFNVAIRTVVVQRSTGRAVYGVGGGVTWSSTAAGEHAEIQAKTRLLDPAALAGFGLLETVRVQDGVATHLAEHLRRLRDSADHLGFRLDEDAVGAAAARRASELGAGVLRLELRRDGGLDLTTRPLPAAPDRPVGLALDTVAVTADPRWLRHKTTVRAHYDEARARHPDAEDVLLVTADGHVSESTLANLAVRLDGVWWTPPVTDGCLPGIGRALALARGELVERSITVADLGRAEALALVSSVRGWRPARLLPSASGGGIGNGCGGQPVGGGAGGPSMTS